jgi:pyridoxal phosphate-dependent aminotransferase EpsN
MSLSKIYLSSPHMGGQERDFVAQAFDSNWLAPLGPNVDGFERELCELVGSAHAAALSSGTAGLHLALRLAGVGQGDEVWVSTFTFVASVNPILYLGARPKFIDSELTSWNMDAALLAHELDAAAARGALPRAVMVVHLYGQCADMDPIVEACARHDVALIEDAAEALGSDYKGKGPGTMGRAGVFSFNGNKIITTTGGGALVSDDADLVAHARKLATQARDPAPHYQHSEVGYNYRMSNVSAGIGRGQLRVLEERVLARRAIFDRYVDALGDLPGVSFAPEADWGRHTRWLTCVRVDPGAFGADRAAIMSLMAERQIEARPVWKPMHLQPLFEGVEVLGGGAVSEEIFADGLCLPSGSNMTDAQLARVIEAFRDACPEVSS